MKSNIIFLFMFLSLTFIFFTGCSTKTNEQTTSKETTKEESTENNPPKENLTETIQEKIPDTSDKLSFNNNAWKYNEEENVYWQVGVVYCENPVATDYQSLGIYVPGDYMKTKDNEDGTYTLEKFSDTIINGYSALTAPIVMPVNTPGYAAQLAPKDYTNGLKDYTNSGFIYVIAGCRGQAMMKGPGGRPGDNKPEDKKTSEPTSSVLNNEAYTNSAPWAVTDLKSAVRYIRYNSDLLPGNKEHIFTFGMSGGGAQSALMGITGDSELYKTYLESIGSAMVDKNGSPISDAVFGAMSWCPITSFDYADAAYEWNMGQYVNSGTRAEGLFTKELSKDLAKVYADYINNLGLTLSDGTSLTLAETTTGIYNSGTYYDYIISTIEKSLNNFLADTNFPYTPNNKMQAGFAGNAGGNDGFSKENTNTTTYQTVEDYIKFLNANNTWVIYDKETNTAKITNLADFVNGCKNATKPVGAFDTLGRISPENRVFGDDNNNPLHFSSTIAKLISDKKDSYSEFSDWNSSYPEDFSKDMAYTNKIGSNLQERMDMYNPMYYISKNSKGYGTSKIAPNIRIRTGLFQGDTALTVEANLALLLSSYEGVNVDFETIWGQYHTTAERTGDATTNFIDWVNESCK